MNYKILILRRSQKELTQLPSEFYITLKEAILSLAENPRPLGCSKLTNRPGWRIKVGAYRVLYEIDDKAREVTILHVGHRRDVYR